MEVRLLAKRVREFWRRFSKSRIAVISLSYLFFLVLVAIFAPYITRYAPREPSRDVLVPPNFQSHLFGTDDLGRDILSGVLYGSRISLTVGLAAAAVAMVIGTVVGAFSGFHGGWLDELLMRITEIVMAIPTFFFALAVCVLVGPSITNIVLIIGLLSWPSIARLVRAEFMTLKGREFVIAARAVGVSTFSLAFTEILPNAIPVAVINTVLQVTRAVILEASLSFLGMGDPNLMSWGYMLQNAQFYLVRAWWMAVFPGISITSTALAFNVCGDALNEALNPRLREV